MGVCVGCAFIRESEKERYMMMYVHVFVCSYQVCEECI